jgi:HD-GYP domain-containing protein (c-di-GMP phosphodiesterase class II)
MASREGGHYDPGMKKHCEYGENNINKLLPNAKIKNFILYHHERADGKGPYGISEGEGPLEAELIAIADSIDVAYHLQTLQHDKFESVVQTIKNETGKKFSKAAVQAMLAIFDFPLIESLRDDVIDETARSALSPWIVDVEDEVIVNLVSFITKIIDYKSVFTKNHSSKIANMAWFMGEYYNYNQEEKAKLYLAAALHDIGKLETPTAILEKPGKLTDEEFTIIKEHVRITWELIKDIDGFEDICKWASNHHEKLNGKGYPFGKNADELDFNSRLMACIDIYQAVSEKRPYHPLRDLNATLEIMYKMADDDAIDRSIVNDISIAMKPYDGKDLPFVN